MKICRQTCRCISGHHVSNMLACGLHCCLQCCLYILFLLLQLWRHIGLVVQGDMLNGLRTQRDNIWKNQVLVVVLCHLAVSCCWLTWLLSSTCSAMLGMIDSGLPI